jgi:predicted phage terminase large subunit-like protein
MEDARSPVIREKVWNWYTGTVYNRLQADGAVVLINHRMHENDLSGRLIEQMKAGKDEWTIVELPAIAIDHDRDGHKIIDPIGRKAGEALWPEEYDLKRLDRRRDNTLARYFSAMYQQQPVPDEGELFAADKLGLRDHTGDIFMRVRAWDLVGTVEGDWTCGVLIGKTKSGGFVVIDVRRMRGTPEKVMAFVKETALADTRRTRISFPEDPGDAGIFQAKSYVKALAGWPVITSKETGDKETRADPFAVQVNNGHVEMIEADWNAAYREELRAFPSVAARRLPLPRCPATSHARYPGRYPHHTPIVPTEIAVQNQDIARQCAHGTDESLSLARRGWAGGKPRVRRS